MKILRTILWLSVCTILMASCKKNQLKKPTEVSVKMDINRSQSDNGSLVFSSGYIRIAEFYIDGIREEGAPVSLSQEFEQGLVINFDQQNFVDELMSNIPQGNYTDLKVGFDTHEGDDEPTIEVHGQFTNSSSQTFPLIFQFMSSEYFLIKGEKPGGSNQIVLDKSIPTILDVVLDPIYWFDIVSQNMLDNANTYDINGVETVVINEEKNETIYDIVADRIDESPTAVFGE